MAAREMKRDSWSEGRPRVVTRQAMQPREGVMLGLESSLVALSQTSGIRPAEMARSKL